MEKTDAPRAGEGTFAVAIANIRAASQALWDWRQKGEATEAQAAFTEPLQDSLSELLAELEHIERFLYSTPGSPR